MRKTFLCILSLLSLSSFAYETTTSCEDMNELIADIEEVSTLVFNNSCEKTSESSFLGIVSTSSYEHSVSIDLEASGLEGNKQEVVIFKKYIKVGNSGNKFVQLQNALNEYNSSELESYFPLENPYASPYTRFVGEFQIRMKDKKVKE